MRHAAMVLFGVLAGCASPRADRIDADATGESPASSSEDGGVPTTSDPATSTTANSGSAGGDDGWNGFIMRPDGGPNDAECDIIAQDCPAGEKCNPYANDGGSSWNSMRCVPVYADPDDKGDPCTVEGPGLTGIDSCDFGLFCWDVDPETSFGMCIPLCTGSWNDPSCEDPNEQCNTNKDGTLALCLPRCEPLVQDCPVGCACYPMPAGDFQCVPDASGDLGGYADPCEFINACDPGLFCADPSIVPGCEGASCCSQYCNLGATDPDAQCEGVVQGQECTPWFAEGDAPPGFENVGACAIPQ